MVAVSPYMTAVSLNRPAPDFVARLEDKYRVQAYFTYSDIYTNVVEAFEVLLRHEASDRVMRRFVPAARSIIEATNRYLGQGLTWITSDPVETALSPEVKDEVAYRVAALFAREEFEAKFMALKRWMLIKGDAILHITADPLKEEGKRLRITEVAPESYFPLYDAVDAERITGCYLVSMVLDDEDEEIAQRIEYRKVMNEDDVARTGAKLGSVYVRYTFWESDGWDDREDVEDLKPVPVPAWAATDSWAAALEGFALPDPITAIPVYHFRNNRRGNAAFGLSELQGIETLLAGIIQNTTDEDLAASLFGVGLYATDSGSPKNPDGTDADWVIAPGSVAELEDDKKFWRVEGVTSFDPMQAHIRLLNSQARETTGTPDVAVGNVDVQAAQSGIALAIQFHPMVAKNQEKEVEMRAKLDQFIFDLLNGWMPAYEGWASTGVIYNATFADPLPVNVDAIIKQVVELVKNKVISVRVGCTILRDKAGFDIDPDTMVAAMAEEASAMLDAEGARLDAAAAGGEEVPPAV